MAPEVFAVGTSRRDMNRGERIVLSALKDHFTDDVRIYCRLDGILRNVRREIDLLVAIPGSGLAIIEVKGSHIRIENGTWEQYRDQEWHTLNIAMQLDEQRRLLLSWIEPVLGRTNIPIAKLVATPDASFDPMRQLPKVRREHVIDREQIETIPQHIFAALNELPNHENYTAEIHEEIHEVLTNQGLKYENLVTETPERAKLVDSLTREQSYILDALEDNKRMYVRGGPGTGKTILAVEKAYRLARDGKRVGIVCHNIGLANHLKHLTAEFPSHAEVAFVGSYFEDLPKLWGVKFPAIPESEKARKTFYEVTAPDTLNRALDNVSEDLKFDAWIIDEGQDFVPAQWATMQKSLKDPDSGEIYIFGDPQQDLYDVSADIPWFMAFGRLKRNLRSARSIAEFINHVEPSEATSPYGIVQGFLPEFYICNSREQVVAEAEKFMETMHNSYGWAKGDLAMLTTHNRSKKHAEGRDTDDQAYWDGYEESSNYFYGRVGSFKGLERPVVIMALDGFTNDEKQLQQIFVGASRARDELIIFGMQRDLDVLKNAQQLLNVTDVNASAN